MRPKAVGVGGRGLNSQSSTKTESKVNPQYYRAPHFNKCLLRYTVFASLLLKINLIFTSHLVQALTIFIAQVVNDCLFFKIIFLFFFFFFTACSVTLDFL